MGKGLLAAVVIAGLFFGGLIIGGICLLLYYNSIQRQGVTFETQLNSQYLDNQNELSTYISKFYETIGVANLKSDKMDQILLDAVKGRYDGKTAAQPGQGQLFSAISEAYPQIDLTIYDKIVELINQGREAYKQKQTKLLGMLANYDNWCKRKDIPHVWMVGGFPSNALEARIGTSVKRGADAREQMFLIVTTKGTQEAYTTGTMDPLQVPGGNKAK